MATLYIPTSKNEMHSRMQWYINICFKLEQLWTLVRENKTLSNNSFQININVKNNVINMNRTFFSSTESGST